LIERRDGRGRKKRNLDRKPSIRKSKEPKKPKKEKENGKDVDPDQKVREGRRRNGNRRVRRGRRAGGCSGGSHMVSLGRRNSAQNRRINQLCFVITECPKQIKFGNFGGGDVVKRVTRHRAEFGCSAALASQGEKSSSHSKKETLASFTKYYSIPFHTLHLEALSPCGR
jgi:hypothetical protein